MRVVLIGNFVVSYCTEVHLARALRELGVEVIELPQDDAFKMGAEHFVTYTVNGPPVDLVAYVRTHNATALADGWNEAWERLGAAGVKTASFHLDRFFDLDRENLVWDHDPLFTTQHVFTADGGNDERFAAAGVNHHWLPPGVDKGEAGDTEMPGQVWRDLDFDVVFAGSYSNYHAQYPQRGELIDHLHRTYGQRFAHFGHGGGQPVKRQQGLNDLYVSAKVIVGDSCFANEPGSPHSTNYWSDRIPETLGRGGFLLHPWVPGVRDFYGPDELATYNPGDWEDLDTQIGKFLANPGDREGFVERGRARVRREHTYTGRMRTLLDTVGLTPSA